MKPTRLAPADLEKLSARAGVNRLRQLFNSGNLQEAEALAAHAPQILAGRNLPRGSQIRRLGSGTEGIAQHVLMPGSATTPAGSAVVKTYDRTSPIYSPQVQQARAGMAGKNIPGHAQTYEFHQGPHTDQAINEFVPSVKGQRPTPAQIAQTQDQVRHAVPGHELLDIGRQNMVLDARTGQAKVIDSIPVPQEHTMPANLRQGMPTNVLNYHLDPASPTGQSMNAFKADSPAWRRDQIYSQLSSQSAPTAPSASRATVSGHEATLPAKKDRTWVEPAGTATETLTDRQSAGLRRQDQLATRMHERELLQRAYNPAAQAPSYPATSQAPTQGTVAARPQAMPQGQAQSTMAARPRMMRPADLSTQSTRR